MRDRNSDAHQGDRTQTILAPANEARSFRTLSAENWSGCSRTTHNSPASSGWSGRSVRSRIEKPAQSNAARTSSRPRSVPTSQAFRVRSRFRDWSSAVIGHRPAGPSFIAGQPTTPAALSQFTAVRPRGWSPLQEGPFACLDTANFLFVKRRVGIFCRS